ncbi:MAG: hypothetical protein WC421_06535 [Elusimicrobiales bacterium]
MVRIGDKVLVKVEVYRIVETKDGVTYGVTLVGDDTLCNTLGIKDKHIISLAER